MIELDLELDDRSLHMKFERNPFINKGCRALTSSTNQRPLQLISMRVGWLVGFLSFTTRLTTKAITSQTVFLGGGNRSARGKPPTFSKQLSIFVKYCVKIRTHAVAVKGQLVVQSALLR